MSAEISKSAALVKAARMGDATAREQLGRQVGDSAFIFALQLTGNRDLALDIAQDGVLKFFKHLDRFDTDKAIEPWLYQIVRNRVRDLARRQKLRNHESLDTWLDSDEPAATTLADTPAEEAERMELQQRIWQSVSKLSDAHREIFILRDYHGLSYSDLAKVLNIAEGTVMSRLHAARMNMRSHLSNERPSDNDQTKGATDE